MTKKFHMSVLPALAALTTAVNTPVAPDPSALATTIVDAVRLHAGVHPDSERGPVASDWIFIDDQSFTAHFENTFDAEAAADVRSAFEQRGYGFGSISSVVTRSADSSGQKTYAIPGNGLVVEMFLLLRNGKTVDAEARYYYTYRNKICRNSLRLQIDEAADEWMVRQSKQTSGC